MLEDLCNLGARGRGRGAGGGLSPFSIKETGLGQHPPTYQPHQAFSAAETPRSLEGHAMSCTLEEALVCLTFTFHKYSDKEGDKNTLSKREFKALIHNEFTSKEKLSDKTIRKMIDELDDDLDQELNFQEYLKFLGELAIILNDMLKDVL
uniref:EF-hand domain-containing protein n=2 Tax=Ornithorhynchus anatinus TaxID=9258 RepID=A0A6I8MY86_ORNAN